MLEINELKSVPLFVNLSTDEIQSIVNEGEYLELKSDDLLFEEDSAGRDLYILIAGKIAIESLVPGSGEKKTKEFYSMNPNEVIGEFSYVDQAPRSATARARRESKVLRIPAENLDRLLDENPKLGYRLMTNISKILCDRIRNANLALRNSMVWI
ncbi:MAG: cyclic nucleotide-binding domain-containing protein [Candidatus Marinimicrobia bacterium]|nr:cyclic nucleotide-binding domain-containing protein [Candidatus Neomarinimicrobiota bacterium]MCF7829757.1 cyclic nucleotide-binding domain-containing protein [Candidatus Neomarinimicrobiota bacterium]MCF7881707.1 cyclic nucleotide-binding domain-containing protein [Candidatus Neomarinimicrobiota bacterium]